jgi:hypothetical protein
MQQTGGNTLAAVFLKLKTAWPKQRTGHMKPPTNTYVVVAEILCKNFAPQQTQML